MSIRDEIIEFIAAFTAVKPERLSTDDVFIGNGVEGDDADELIIEFSEKFGVNIDDFLDYFHYVGDEPPGHRRVFPVDEQKQIIPFQPVTIDTFVQAVEIGRWPIVYPQHTVGESLRWRLLKIAAAPLLVMGILFLVWDFLTSNW
ncbi:DUF1493 family protein [Yoonia sp. GPGPB17]|uniref:DUF1493 family protein n=1 Tax=Yoonia sp. GPGPB17 TaxID=3026147 RepID=UPI0030C1FAFF